MTQVNSANSVAAQLQSLENAALGQYQSGQDFSILMQQAGAGGTSTATAGGGTSTTGASTTSSGSSSSGGFQLGGKFSSSSLVAVGSMGSDGQMVMYPQSQIDAEYAALGNARQASFSDSLKNFMTLAQQASPDGQVGASSFSDHQQFNVDNGLVSGNFDTSLWLKPVGGATPT